MSTHGKNHQINCNKRHKYFKHLNQKPPIKNLPIKRRVDINDLF
jgi:hypothetical protein